jgi:urease accessory protein
MPAFSVGALMLLIERGAPADAVPTERLVLPFESRCKSRLRTRLASGEEVGLFLERGAVLRGGDRLQGSDGRIVAVIAAPEKLMEARFDSPAALARAAYHMGNRHVAVQLGIDPDGHGWLRFEADAVLGDMLRGLQASLIAITAPFEPESGAYATGHGHGESRGDGRIHEYGQRQWTPHP